MSLPPEEKPSAPRVVPLYTDEVLGIVMKPAGLLVHRSEVAPDAEAFALQQARDLFGRRVYAAHRLDRGTSGVLIFSFDPETAATVARQFETGVVRKRYAVLVRGWINEPCRIDYALKPVRDPYLRTQKTEAQPAVTDIEPWARTEVPVAFGDFASVRVTLLGAEPETGRRHQIRRHLKHIAHPVIGDSTYGKGALNRTLAAYWGEQRMFLHCARLALTHPVTGERLDITAPADTKMNRILQSLGLESYYNARVAAPWTDAAPQADS